MELAKLNKILGEHKKWLQTDGEEGTRANLRNANLRNADLSYADLRNADLRNADLSYADLRNTNLRNTNLSYADLRNTNLRNADLRNTNLDFSAFPLWCGGLNVHIDDRLAIQILYHLVRDVQFSKNTSAEMKKICKMKSIVKKANEFHRVNECGEIVIEKEE